MKNILNKFLLFTLVALPTTQVFGAWQQKFEEYKKKTKTFVTDKKNIKAGTLLTLSAIAGVICYNNKYQDNRLVDVNERAAEHEKKWGVSASFSRSRQMAFSEPAKEHSKTSILSGIASAMLGIWGMKVALNK